MGIFMCTCCGDKCMGCSCLLCGGQSIWFCNFSCSASGLFHPCLRRELSSTLSRSVCSWSASVLLAFLMGILWLLPCKFGTHLVFFGANVGSSCFFSGSSSDQCLWLWELLQRRVLSSFMGVQEKQMKQCDICQMLSSALLLSDIYSCTCLMLILFCFAWPFLWGTKKWSPLKSGIFVQQLKLSVVISVCIIHFYCVRMESLILRVCFLKSPSGESHQVERSCYGFGSSLDALCWPAL